jgi:hypothetical protein
LPRHPLRIGVTNPFQDQPVGMRHCGFTARRRSGDGIRLRREIRTAPLAGCGRGTIEKDTRPISGDRVRPPQHVRRGSDPDKEDFCDEHHKRHYRVHHDAELAMVGVTPNRMHMRYLGDGEKRQQDKAHPRRRFQSARP